MYTFTSTQRVETFVKCKQQMDPPDKACQFIVSTYCNRFQYNINYNATLKITSIELKYIYMRRTADLIVTSKILKIYPVKESINKLCDIVHQLSKTIQYKLRCRCWIYLLSNLTLYFPREIRSYTCMCVLEHPIVRS